MLVTRKCCSGTEWFRDDQHVPVFRFKLRWADSNRDPGVGEWSLAGVQSGQREANMAGKDKGGRSAKTPAAKSAKEKRQSKKDKKAGKSKNGPLL